MVLGFLGLLWHALQKNRPLFWVPGIAAAPLALIAVVLLPWALGMLTSVATACTVSMVLLWSALIAMAGRTLVDRVGERVLTTQLARFLFAGGLVKALFGLLQLFGLSQAFGGWISRFESSVVRLRLANHSREELFFSRGCCSASPTHARYNREEGWLTIQKLLCENLWMIVWGLSNFESAD